MVKFKAYLPPFRVGSLAFDIRSSRLRLFQVRFRCPVPYPPNHHTFSKLSRSNHANLLSCHGSCPKLGDFFRQLYLGYLQSSAEIRLKIFWHNAFFYFGHFFSANWCWDIKKSLTLYHCSASSRFLTAISSYSCRIWPSIWFISGVIPSTSTLIP